MLSANAQDTIATSPMYWNSYNNGDVKTGTYFFPVAQHVNIYTSPTVQSKVVYKTKAYADTLQVLEVLKEKPSRFKNLYSYWCKVSFSVDGKWLIGYVPGQFLSGVCVRENDIVYLISLITYSQYSFEATLKILKNYQLVHEHKFSPVSNASYNPVESDTGNVAFEGYLDIVLRGNKGLKGVDRILEVYSGYDACGYINGSNQLFIKDDKVIQEIEASDISEAGIFYSNAYFIFPSDSSGKKNHLIKKHETSEVVNDSVSEESVTTEYFKWNGQLLKKTDSTYQERTIKVPFDAD
jgi:hypothetical protein